MNESHALTVEVGGGRLDEHPDTSRPFLAFRLSWVAYLPEFVSFVIRFILCALGGTLLSLVLDRFAHMHTMTWLPGMGVFVAGLWTVYSVMLTRSVRLFTDDAGVWVQSGVFPWDRGFTGVQWRDLGQAGFTQGFMSWMLRSYDVRISHRFTTGTEIYLKNVRFGNLAVAHVNRIMIGLLGSITPR